jgi:hypothetical protein
MTAPAAATPAASTTPDAVSCVSKTFCVAVGSTYNGTSTRQIAQRWNGTRWSAMTLPTTGTADTELSGISCATIIMCAAVGTNGSERQVEMWNGKTWRVVSTPAPSAARTSALTALDCPSTRMCLAVGEYTPTAKGSWRNLVERWNGSRWALTQIVNSTTKYPGIGVDAVSCATVSHCEVAGAYGSNGGQSDPNPIAEVWNGKSWHVQPMIAQRGGVIRALSCASTTACIAVGSFEFGQGAAGALAQRWDGHTWRKTAPSNGSTPAYAELTAVSCRAATSCLALADNANRGFAEKWTGSRWAVTNPTVPAHVAANQFGLYGTSCLPAPAKAWCMSVGAYYTSSTGTDHGIAETWNGSRWGVHSMPE